MKSAGVPVVITHGTPNDAQITGLPCISVSERDGWESAIAYLAGLGHQRIAIIGHVGSDLRGHSFSETLQILKKHDASSDESMIRMTEFNRDEIIDTVKALCSNPGSRPTAILCFSDFYAIYVYDALKELKLRIPDDIAVMGICGYPDARLLNPPLSTIDYGYAKFAEMAVEMLQEPEKWIDPATGKGKLRLKPFKLIKRQSTELIWKT
jgi:DNA-binding LacI/PurR family transcriptional regulator